MPRFAAPHRSTFGFTALVAVLASGFLASGCAMPSWQPVPVDVTMVDAQLRVAFTDGATCSADTTQAKSGTFGDCEPGFGYAVEYYRPSLASGTGLSKLFQDYATIRLTRASDGRHWVVRTPPDMNRDSGPETEVDRHRS